MDYGDREAVARCETLARLLTTEAKVPIDGRSVGVVLGLLEGLAGDDRTLSFSWRDDGVHAELRSGDGLLTIDGVDLVDVVICFVNGPERVEAKA
jgi:hypothetical protein